MKVTAMKTTTNQSGWFGGFMSVLASAVGLTCPACIPAFASLLASMGIGVAAAEQFIRPMLVGLLVIAVAAFAWSAKLHRHWWVVLTGIIGGVLVYLGRYFVFDELWITQVALWTGTVLLVVTSLVNLVLKRACASCSKEQTE
jgi:hypothetical protein